MAAAPLAPHLSVSSAVPGAAAVTLASADAAASALRDALLSDCSAHPADGRQRDTGLPPRRLALLLVGRA
eukprot:1500940-Pleurochrysis_carterae.AAC.1